MRLAWAAISISCVTITMVMPSRLSWQNIWIISLAVGVVNAILFIIGFFVIFGVLEKFVTIDGKTKDTITIIKDGKSTTYEEK